MGCCNWQSVRIFYQDDLAQAETLGTEAVDWLTERQRLQDERLATSPVQPYSFHVANIFPNFSMIGMGTAFLRSGIHHVAASGGTAVDRGLGVVFGGKLRAPVLSRNAWSSS